MNKLKNFLYQNAKKLVLFIVQLFGPNLLDKEATLKKLKPYQIFSIDGETVIMPIAGVTYSEIPETYKVERSATTSSIGVYKITNADDFTIYPYGGVKLGKDVLDMDFGSAIFINTLFKADDRETIKTDSCIVLWSHYWGEGFYDYILFVYAKLLRIKSAIGEEEFKKCKIIYPLVGTGFEIELLRYAEVDEYQIIDSRAYTIEANTYYLANNDNWYHHNRHDLNLIRETLSKVKNSGPTYERVYISRKGRRRVLNEPEVVKVLKEFNFTILYDEPRSVAEQVTIYRNAKVIIGPHGASFANILNCNPGTVLIELFPDDYHPDYFRFMAHIFNLNYFAIFEDGVVPTEYWQVNENMTIDAGRVRRTLKNILG